MVKPYQVAFNPAGPLLRLLHLLDLDDVDKGVLADQIGHVRLVRSLSHKESDKKAFPKSIPADGANIYSPLR